MPLEKQLTKKQRDFILLTMFVLAQHGHFVNTSVLAEALSAIGDNSTQVISAKTVTHFLNQSWRQALANLEELDNLAPIERFGMYRQTRAQRVRRYMRARCLYEIGEKSRAKDAIESYLRYGDVVSGME